MSNLAECVAKIKALLFMTIPFIYTPFEFRKRLYFRCFFFFRTNNSNKNNNKPKPTNVHLKILCKFTWNSHSYHFAWEQNVYFFFYCSPAHLILDCDLRAERKREREMKHVFEADVNKWKRSSLKYPLAFTCIVLHEESSTAS